MLKSIILLLCFTSIFNSSFSQNKEIAVDVEKLKTENTLLNAKIQTLEAKVELLKLEIENLKTQFANLAKQPATAQIVAESQTTPTRTSRSRRRCCLSSPPQR